MPTKTGRPRKFLERIETLGFGDDNRESFVPPNNNYGAPGTMKALEHSWEMMTAYRTELNRRREAENKTPIDLQLVGPNAEDFIFFIDQCLGTKAKNFQDAHLQSHIAGKVIQLSTLGGHLANIFIWAQRHYGTWKLNTEEKARIRATVHRAVQVGACETGRWFPRQAIGIRAVTHMITAALVYWERAGALCWDVVISRLLCISLAVATGCRAGALTVSDGYPDDHTLCYSDIQLVINTELKVPGRITLGDVSTFITLRFEKGDKSTKNNNTHIKTQPQLSTPMICCSTWLLIHSLRHGRVVGCSLQEILDNAGKRSDRTIQWTHPNEPVICRIHDKTKRLVLGSAANAYQPRRSIRLIGKISGFSQRITFHALRHGAAAEAAQLPASSFNLQNAHQILHHSHKTTASGITDHYAGPNEVDFLSARNKSSRVSHKDLDLFPTTTGSETSTTGSKTSTSKLLFPVQKWRPGEYQTNPCRASLETFVNPDNTSEIQEAAAVSTCMYNFFFSHFGNCLSFTY